MRVSNAVTMPFANQVPSVNAEVLRSTNNGDQQVSDCSFCGLKFPINSPADLSDATWVQNRLGAGVTSKAGPLCCPRCRLMLESGQLGYCLQCGKAAEGAQFCSHKCSVAYCED